MKLILLIVSTIFVASSCHSEYEEVINGLSENHVMLYESMGKEDYLNYFNLTEADYQIKVKEYAQAVESFYNSDKELLDYLLTFESDTNTISTWISTPNPLSSSLNEGDLFSNSRAALILVDNFLLNEGSNHISKNRKIDISYPELKEFYKKNKIENLSQIRKNYKKLIRNK